MIDTQIDTKKLERAIKIVPRQLKIELGDAFDYLGRKFLKTLWKTRLQGPPRLRARPRGLFKHFKRVMLVPSTGIDGMGTVIYTKSKIARIHEEGGVITGKGGKRLAVPLSMRSQMYTGRGSLKKRYKEPGKIKNLREIPLKGKRFLVKFKKKRDSELKRENILYVKKNQIRIKPRLGFFDTWDGLERLRIPRINRAIQKALETV